MQKENIDYIFDKLSKKYHYYSNKKPAAKIHKHAYKSLIGVMLSAQSQDKRTSVACNQLFAKADTPEQMIQLTQDEIIEAIRPAGLHNAKSKNILATSHLLLKEFEGKVPQTQKELMSLPGVGRKSSDIMMRFVWGQPHIAVDTHVFRLLWRLGWADSLDGLAPLLFLVTVQILFQQCQAKLMRLFQVYHTTLPRFLLILVLVHSAVLQKEYLQVTLQFQSTN